jgi:hypothetical protein
MAVEIKSGASSDLATVDATSKAFRVTSYNTDGTVVDTTVPISIAINPVTVVDNDILASFDASAYKFVSIQLTGTWVGTVAFQGSNDNGTFEDIVVQNTGSVLTPYVLSMSAIGGVKIPVLFKYLRIRVTAYTSGTVDGTAFGLKEDANTGQISSVGTVNIGAGQTVATVTNLSQIGGAAVSMGAGVVDAGTQRVSLTSNEPVILGAGTAAVGSTFITPNPTETLETDFYAAAGGAVDVNSRFIKDGPTTLYSIVLTNYAATARHVKIYNTSTATDGAPVAGAGTPVLVLSMPSGGTMAYPLPSSGYAFSKGIGMTMVQGAANNNAIGTATAPDVSVTSVFTA